MKLLSKSIALIGFKHTGKTVVGRSLALLLNVPFVDLDQQIEQRYATQFHEQRTCREIMQQQGEEFFRHLENAVLVGEVAKQTSVISLGGGAPLLLNNQHLIKKCTVVHLTAPKEVVYERIRGGGHPAFFAVGRDLLESFNRIWDDRQRVYEALKDFTILNEGEVEEAAFKLIEEL